MTLNLTNNRPIILTNNRPIILTNNRPIILTNYRPIILTNNRPIILTNNRKGLIFTLFARSPLAELMAYLLTYAHPLYSTSDLRQIR